MTCGLAFGRHWESNDVLLLSLSSYLVDLGEVGKHGGMRIP
jgi:hypothetical protein